MGNKLITGEQQIRVMKPHRTHLSRRHFLLGIAAISAAAIIPTTIACSATPVHDIHGQLSDDDFATLMAVQNHLFPTDKNSPGAIDLNAASYFTWVLTDSEKDEEDKIQMRDGIGWTNETAEETYSKKFVDLYTDEKEKVLRLMANEGWGESWLSVVLTNIFEALLSDPVYGSNTNESGWKWLEHTAGNPRPEKENMYNPVAV